MHYTVFSGDNITVVSDKPTTNKTIEVEFHECKDADGKNYKIVQIGVQWWMAENMAYLPEVSLASEESKTQKQYYVYGYEGNNISEAKTIDNFKTFGALYNWLAAISTCPSGWHLPGEAEWNVLSNHLINNNFGYAGGEEDIAKAMAAKTKWNSSSTAATPGNESINNNSSGFSGLPGGNRDYTGVFKYSGSIGYWWSDETCINCPGAFHRALFNTAPHLDRGNSAKIYGYSVRCVKD